MSDADASLEILIKSVLDATGYRMNEEEAKKLQGSLGKLSDTTKEGAKAAEKSEISHRALHQILHLIGAEAGPAAGAALSGVAAAATGGMLFAVMAIRELFEWLHGAAEKAKQFKETMEAQIDISGLVGGVKDVKDAVDDTGKAVDKFFEDLEHKAADKNGFKKIADDQIAHLQRVAEAEKKLAAEEADREKARLDILKASHKISDDDYKAGVKAAEDLKSKTESDIAKRIGSQSEAALSQALVNITAQAEEARRALEAEKAKPDSAKHQETLKGLLTATRDQLQKTQDVQSAPPGFFSDYGSALLNMTQHPLETSDAFRQRISDELGAKMNELRGQEASLQAQIAEAKKNAPDQDKIKRLESQLTGFDSDTTAIQDELSKRRDQGAVDKTAGTVSFAQQFAEAQSRLQAHQGTQADQQTIVAMNRLLQTTRESDQTTYTLLRGIIEQLSQHKQKTQQDFSNLAQRIERVGK